MRCRRPFELVIRQLGSPPLRIRSIRPPTEIRRELAATATAPKTPAEGRASDRSRDHPARRSNDLPGLKEPVHCANDRARLPTRVRGVPPLHRSPEVQPELESDRQGRHASTGTGVPSLKSSVRLATKMSSSISGIRYFGMQKKSQRPSSVVAAWVIGTRCGPGRRSAPT